MVDKSTFVPGDTSTTVSASPAKRVDESWTRRTSSTPPTERSPAGDATPRGQGPIIKDGTFQRSNFQKIELSKTIFATKTQIIQTEVVYFGDF